MSTPIYIYIQKKRYNINVVDLRIVLILCWKFGIKWYIGLSKIPYEIIKENICSFLVQPIEWVVIDKCSNREINKIYNDGLYLRMPEKMIRCYTYIKWLLGDREYFENYYNELSKEIEYPKVDCDNDLSLYLEFKRDVILSYKNKGRDIWMSDDELPLYSLLHDRAFALSELGAFAPMPTSLALRIFDPNADQRSACSYFAKGKSERSENEERLLAELLETEKQLEEVLDAIYYEKEELYEEEILRSKMVRDKYFKGRVDCEFVYCE